MTNAPTSLRIAAAGIGALQEPTYGTDGAACFDLRAISGATIHPGKSVAIGTGLIFEVPVGWCLEVYGRSGMGIVHDVRLSNCTGIIDSDYRGEVVVGLRNDSPMEYVVKAGDRIAQAKLAPIHRVSFEWVDVGEIARTARGGGGLGSTGKS